MMTVLFFIINQENKIVAYRTLLVTLTKVLNRRYECAKMIFDFERNQELYT